MIKTRTIVPKGNAVNDFDPGRVKDISRWLSAAIPPVNCKEASTLAGVVARSEAVAATLPGSTGLYANETGGIAALNHRLMAEIPPGSFIHKT